MNEKKFPPLPYEKWKDTLDTLHLWMQIAGKVKLSLNPFRNHWWQVAFHFTSSGLRSGLIPYKEDAFEISFDFIHHNLLIHKTDDRERTLKLYPCTVSEFYTRFMEALTELDISVIINTLPVEFAEPVAFEKDTVHSSYDKEYVFIWWRLYIKLVLIFEQFQSVFRGKSSPVHFFWGSFDISSTRFSGNKAKPPEYGGKIVRFAENEENFSFGFWPGDNRYPAPAFYSYIYPEPDGIRNIKPAAGSFNTLLSDFILPYDEVRNSSSPEDLIMKFLTSTYDLGAKLAGWNVKELKGDIP